MNPLQLILAPSAHSTRLLMSEAGRDVLQAILSPSHQAHPQAARTILEGLSLWYQAPLSVVLCVEESASSYALEGLVDGYGIGQQALHYQVGVAVMGRKRRCSLTGMGSFRDLRSLGQGQVLT